MSLYTRSVSTGRCYLWEPISSFSRKELMCGLPSKAKKRRGHLGALQGKLVRAAGLEPAWACAQRIFLPATAFAARSCAGSARERFGVWTIPSPWPCGFRCCPSSLYTFPFPGLARDCHLTGSPEFGQFCIFGFPESTQVCLSPLRLPVSPRPHRG